jgi:fermentation-respiration switch protein FrsA (DUF1100 family)
MLKLLAIAALGYGALVVTVYLMQGRMLYLANVPGRELTATPANIGLEYEDVALMTEDGVTLHGWFIPGTGSRTVLFFHGNAGNISHRLDSIRQFHRLDLSVFIIDYRGYGQSGGKAGEAGIYRDARAAWRYLDRDRGIRPDDIIVFGRSMGASAAAKLATNVHPLGLIVESSFTSIPDIAQELYPWLPAKLLSHLRHATRDYVAEVHRPVLIVHSKDDEIVPFHHGEAIYAAANEPRSFLRLRGGHNDAWLLDEKNYVEGLRAFLDQL